MNIETLLETSNFFSGISDRNRKSLAAICRAKALGKREYLFHEGEKGGGVYILSTGSIQLMKNSPDGKEIVIKTVAPGETFAEVVLFEKDSYPVSAVALKPSDVFEVSKSDFHQLLKDPVFRDDFIGMLCQRMRYLTDRIMYLTTYDVDERLFSFLREHYGKREQYDLPIAKKDIAAAIGATPETFSRLILRLTKEKLATLDGKTLTLKKDFWESHDG